MNKAFAFFVVLFLPYAALAAEQDQAQIVTGAALVFLRLGLVIVCALALFVLYISLKNGVLHDRKPYDGLAGLDAKQIPYSLSRFQLTLWTVVIFGSYVYLTFTMGRIDIVLSDQALMLMGLSVGTSLGAAIIDTSTPDGDALQKAFDRAKEMQADLFAARAEGNDQKTKTAEEAFKMAQANLKSLAPKSENMFNDMTCDANGVNLQRVQMLAWTFVVVVLFLAGIDADKPTLPLISATLVALMGLSNGVYLGFKIPEKQAKEQ
ncbi:MAG: hypothetical protein WC722_01200 [Rhodospirillales bacterium]|jgi:hypothetical protein